MKLRVLFVMIALFVADADARGQWREIGPREAFSVHCVVVAPGAAQTIYALGALDASRGGGAAWRTADGGSSWRRMRPQAPGIDVLAVDPVDSRKIYAAQGQIVYRSVDAGSTWMALGRVVEDGPHLSVFDLSGDPRAPGTLYAAVGDQGSSADGAALRSRDGGATWSATGLNGSLVYDVACPAGDPRAIYAAGSTGLFVSSDGGATFAAVGPPGVRARHMAVAVDPTDPRRIFVGTSGEGLFKTVDGGESWSADNPGLTHPTIYAVVFDPGRPNEVWVGTSGAGVFRSRDGGKNWHDTGLATRYTACLAVVPGDPSTVYAAAARRGLFRWDEPARSPRDEVR